MTPFIRLICAAALAVAGSASLTSSSANNSSFVFQVQNANINVNVAALLYYCPNQIVQNFPTSGPAETTWTICWHEVAGSNSLLDPNGLVIGPVYFKKSPSAPAIEVIHDMRVSDYFVPYHPGNPRYYDLSFFNFVLTGVAAADCPASAGGTLVSPHVCKEVHDRGLMWKDGGGVRRGEELVLWGAIDADNYRYIQEYTFRDDGVIGGRMGATGQNLPGSEHVTHVHNAIWRIDMDLAGTANTAWHLSHSEDIVNPPGVATDSATQLTTAQGFQWGARSHDALQLMNPNVKNKQGNSISYVLMPMVTGGGLTQHYEDFTKNDFWVTPYVSNQFAAKNLASYVAGGPSLTTTKDLVLWFKGSLHHVPRSEDGTYVNNTWMGTAHVMWAGFMLMPHDLFDCSPLYKPCP